MCSFIRTGGGYAPFQIESGDSEAVQAVAEDRCQHDSTRPESTGHSQQPGFKAGQRQLECQLLTL